MDAVRDLVQLGADVNGTAGDGQTPLGRAILENNVEMIRTLAEVGADVYHHDDDGSSHVCFAADNDRLDAIRILSELGVDINTPMDDGRTPVFIAAQHGNVGAIEVLCDLGADANAPKYDGRTPLFMAAQNGHSDAVRALAKLGANVHTTDEDRDTPLHIAAHGGAVRVIQELIHHGADIHCRDREGCAPLYVACLGGHVGAIRALIGMRANIDEGSNRYASALRRVLLDVTLDNRRQVSLLLVNHGVDIRQSLLNMQPAHTDLIHNMMFQLFDSVSWSDHHTYDKAAESISKCSLFSLTKLLSSASRDYSIASCVDIQDDTSEEHNMFETAIANSLVEHLSVTVVTEMQSMCYVLKRRLVRVAWRVYQSFLQLDGDRISLSVKARRYMEVVCFLFDFTMLGEVLALRMTCKSNSERRRFPVYFMSSYQELEANIIEECVAYSSCRLVSTDVIHAVMAIHRAK